MVRVKSSSKRNLFPLFPLFPLLLLVLLMSPAPTRAAVSGGDLIKLPNDGNPDTTHDSAVYYVGVDGKRYVFPNDKVYFSWYGDFGAVREVSEAEMSSLSIGGNVTYRPGTRLVKITSDPKVYAVEPGGSLRPIASENVAEALYGGGWNTIIDDVSDAFFVNYTIGNPLSAAVYPTGSVVKRASDGAVFYMEGGLKRHVVSMDVFSALRLQERYVIRVSGALSEYPDGADLTSGEPALTDTSGRNTVSPSSPPSLSLGTPASSYIGVGSDATLLELRVSSGSDVTMTRLTVRLDATTDGGADTSPVSEDDPDDTGDPGDDDIGNLIYGNNARANLSNIRFVDASGAAVMGVRELTLDILQDQSQTLVFTGNYRVPAGQVKTLYLKAVINRQLPEGQGYRATLPNNGISLTGSAGTYVPFLPTVDLAGPALTTAADKMTVTVEPSYGNKTYIRGAKNASVVGFRLKASSAGTNVVTSINFQGYIDEQEGNTAFVAGGDADNGTATLVRDMLPIVSLYSDTGTPIAGPVSVDSLGNAQFSGLSLAIPAGSTQVVVIRGDISGTVNLETNPNRLSFDIVDASTDLAVRDGSGALVEAQGINPNGGTSPVAKITVQEAGTMEFDWSGAGGNTVAGKEVQFGTLRMETEDDAYAVRTLTFRNVGTSKTSLGDMRLEYSGRNGSTVSVVGQWVGDYVTFSGLDAPVPLDGVADIRLFGSLKPRDGGAVYGETLSVTLSTAGPLQWVSDSSGTLYDEDDLGSADYPLIRHTQSNIIVKFSALTVAVDPDSPKGDIYRGYDVEVLRFRMTVDSGGPVRLKKLTFKITPGDAGASGPNNDALERWADVNGDFADDDGMVNLKRVVEGGTDVTLAEGSSGRVRYSFAGDDTPADRDSASGDYATLVFEFNDGNEYFIPAGAVAIFAMELQTAAFASYSNYPLEIQLLSGSDFLWTDIPSGSYTARTGSEASGTGFKSPAMIVRL